MAVNIRRLIMDSFLRLAETHRLNDITVKMILEDTGCARQTFYHHFRDRNDLICAVYDERIIPDYSQKISEDFDFRSSLILSLENMKAYRKFLEQALRMEGSGCLKDHMLKHCISFDMHWHQLCYGSEEMSEELRFATEYHAIASHCMTVSWILSGMPSDTEEMADMITRMRAIGMDRLFEASSGTGNPYRQTD